MGLCREGGGGGGGEGVPGVRTPSPGASQVHKEENKRLRAYIIGNVFVRINDRQMRSGSIEMW